MKSQSIVSRKCTTPSGISIFVTIAILTVARVATGQISDGVITYETKMNMHRTLPKEREEMKNMIPEYRVTNQELLFNANESLFKHIEEDEDIEPGSNGPVMRMRIQQPFNEIYFNQGKSTRITVQEFMGKEYLIEDSIKLPPWKFGTQTKEILGHACKQAMYYNEERKQEVVAWYAPQLRQFLGPEIFNTLPGAILEVDINKGERVITAKKIGSRPLKKNELKSPNRGIKTTRAEFQKMMEEHAERMRANGADVIIRN